MAARLVAIVGEQIDALEMMETTENFNENRVKAVTVLVKTLQAIDNLLARYENNEDPLEHGPEDILEFRRQLARKIEALGKAGNDRQMDQQA
jgi:hypothetical protein